MAWFLAMSISPRPRQKCGKISSACLTMSLVRATFWGDTVGIGTLSGSDRKSIREAEKNPPKRAEAGQRGAFKAASVGAAPLNSSFPPPSAFVFLLVSRSLASQREL